MGGRVAERGRGGFESQNKVDEKEYKKNFESTYPIPPIASVITIRLAAKVFHNGSDLWWEMVNREKATTKVEKG